MPTIIDGSASATFATPLPLSQGGTGNTSGNVVSSQVAGALNATGSAPLYACRAWVNFNGTGTVAIRASGNVSSITDNGVGDFTTNFTTALEDVNYVVLGSAGSIATNLHADKSVNENSALKTTASSRISTRSSQNSANAFPEDLTTVFVAIFR